MQKPVFYFVNLITIYRLVAAPIMIILIFTGNLQLFKWLLPLSFFTDLIDGFLARKYNVSSVIGSKLDSIADDLTILAAVIGVFRFKIDFIYDNLIIASVLIFLFLIQIIYSLIKYHKPSSFHTYLAKAAAILQGFFLILLFLLPQPIHWLFYSAAVVTVADLLEEIVLVRILLVWETDVKGLYWVNKRKQI
jgi:phosphatidylglycerophosphate synthase